MKSAARVYYKEEQDVGSSPTIWVLYLGFLVSVGTIGFGLYQQVVQGKPWGDRPASTAHLEIVFAVVFVIMAAMIIFAHRMTLFTVIDETGVRFRITPKVMKEKHITKEQISRYEIRKYRPAIEYGGWGFRMGGSGGVFRRKRWGVCYKVKGNIGLQLYLTNGRKILIGTQNPTSIERAMKKLME